MRLDRYLVENGLARTRSQARESILRGAVTVDGAVAKSAGQRVIQGAAVLAEPAPFVGRGAHKLAHALDHFGVCVVGARALDVGASTGGFTEVLLRRGAERVIALDVGRDQLAGELAADPRVLVRDGVNARGLGPRDLPFAPDLVVVDVSFISLTLVLPAVLAVAADRVTLVTLIKPQFEVGRAHVGRGGLVRDEAAAEAAVSRVLETLSRCGLNVQGTTRSPIAGGDGNVEWLAVAAR